MRTNKLIKRVQLIASIASIVTCLVVTGFTLVVGVQLVRSSRSAAKTAAHNGQHTVAVGDTLTPLDLNWAASERTLVLALSSDCGYCRASAPFYQTLAKATNGHKPARLAVVLPQDLAAGRQYLNEIGVPVSEVKQLNLSALGVWGTPTLMLVNSAGVVTDLWIGKLNETQQVEVLSRLQGLNAP
ncbi:MAG TPA: hypothetical protein VF525_10385 [Pyrinomonadaceae bacterium]|jgi:thiol-disulfide isomerase/thioredoxin